MKRTRKRYCLYDTFSTYYILGGLLFMYAGCVGICVDLAIKRDEMFFMACIMFLVPAFIIMPILGRSGQLFSRYMIRCRFTEEGIMVFNPIWKRFTIRWADIHTYGMFNSSYSYVSMDLIFLSMDGTELDIPKQRARISKQRLVFQHRDDLWPALSEYLPADMKKHLEESMRTGRGCYVRR